MPKQKLKMYARRPFLGESEEVTSDEAFHFSVGSMLGDGSLPAGQRYIEIEQASPKFTKWKWEKCKEFDLCVERPDSPFKEKIWKLSNSQCVVQYPLRVKVRDAKADSKYDIYTPFYFATRALYDKNWRDLFYIKRDDGKRAKYRKRISPNISDFFWGDLALAIWFLDDGWYDHEKKTACFSTEEWPRDECYILKECLKTNFNLDVRIYPKTGNPHHLYLENYSYPEFYSRVAPYIRDDFEKKYSRYSVSNKMKNKVIIEPF